MLTEQQHITLTLPSADDFETLLTFLRAADCSIRQIQELHLTVECCVDDFVLSLAKKYVDPVITYHSRLVPVSHTPFIGDQVVHRAAG